MQSGKYSLKVLAGVVIKDLPRFLYRLLRKGNAYLALCNRAEQVNPSTDGRGYHCRWQWASDLHAPRVLPFLGRWLMQRALADHPLNLEHTLVETTTQPDISFIIGHRGLVRLPHLLATLESIAGQQGAAIECIVVEQDVEPLLLGKIPAWVRHIHTPPPVANMPYCRSWTFNIAVKEAKGRVVVLHDNDMLVPKDYAAEILARVNQGFDVVNLKRFIFYLSEAHSQVVFNNRNALLDHAPETIVQNLEAGGSVAITREAYERIGGMDESFIGWGGEDNEFWERAQTCKVWSFGYLPIVHLWHASQPEKHRTENPNLLHYQQRASVVPEERIRQLCSQIQGRMSGPNGYLSAKS